jgi:O-antigen/teichoic acid export membrane protein
MIKRLIRQVSQGNLLFTIFINVILAILSLVSGSLAARLLGVAGRGELAAIQTWPTFFAGFSMMGLSEAIVYFSAKEPRQAGRYLTTAIVLTLVASVPFMIISYVLLPVLLPAQSLEVVKAAQKYIFMIPLFSLMGLPLQALRGRNDLFVWNSMRLLLPLGWVFVLVILGILGRRSGEEFAFAYLVLVGLLLLPVLITFFKRISGPYQFDRGLWIPMMKFGLPSVVASIPVILNLRLDQMLMAAFMPLQVLGLYVVAVAWASAVSPMLGAIGIVIFPRIASQSTLDERIEVLLQGIHLAVLTGCFIIISLWAITPLMLPLIFGQAFKPAIISSLILIVAGVVSSINLIFEDSARGLGSPIIVLISECAGLVVTIFILVLLLKPFGILGASIASLLGYSFTQFALIVQIRRITNLRFSVILLPTRSDVTWFLIRLRGLVRS